MKKTLIALTALCLCLPAIGQAYGPGYPGAAPSGWQPGPGRHHRQMAPWQQGPRALLRNAVDGLRAFMAQNDSADEMKMAVFLETEISPLFDFAYMAQWAAGQRYADLSDKEKSAMQGEIKRLFLSALAKGLGGSYADSRLFITNARPVSNKEVQVGLRVLRRNGPPTNMKFRFYLGEQGWKIFDVIAFNSSAVMYFRSHFQGR
ncbi:MAG: ABC transporter substrate-binding protein [Gammaproteobacteria bacterium SHHR-1]|uniref:MlaC/ttg2D family ABC transporter substrate-binding protein n=1 Tax=Magnetovirga frankeli TaxID=947516 RepID=UPI001AF699B3|nr:ABC transporter substrate-binding protein [gamma proteobacterium SS-5]